MSCTSSSKQSFGGGGGGISLNDIISETDMIVERGNNPVIIDEVLQTSQNLLNMYNSQDGVQQFMIAKLKPSAQGAIAYYDGTNIAVNETYMNKSAIEQAYKDSVASGYHPSNGSKTAMEAVIAHEFGHALTDAVGRKMGVTGIDNSAKRILSETIKSTRHKSAANLASKISGYALQSEAEAIAEAFSDVYCNGNKATKESQAIMKVVNSYLK